MIVAVFSACALLFLATSSPGVAAPGAQVTQCNGSDNGGGLATSCEVTIVNNLDLTTGAGSSTVSVTECHGAANAPPLCTTSSTPSPQLTTSVVQCQGSANGGGSTITCTVKVTSNITGTATSHPATVNQCIGSGTGGGIEPTTDCAPVSSTTGATVSQCNGSGNGGGASRRVQCTVPTSTESDALRVTVAQCNDSGNGGGSLVKCSSTLSDNLVAAGGASPSPSAPASASPSVSPTSGTPVDTEPSTSPNLTTLLGAASPSPGASASQSPSSSGLGDGAVTSLAHDAATTDATLPFTGFPVLYTVEFALLVIAVGNLCVAGAMRRSDRARRQARHGH